MLKEWVDNFARILNLKNNERPALPVTGDVEILWKEWLNPKFCCRLCTLSGTRIRNYIPRISARDENDVIENGAYVIAPLGCEESCPKFQEWRINHPL